MKQVKVFGRTDMIEVSALLTLRASPMAFPPSGPRLFSESLQPKGAFQIRARTNQTIAAQNKPKNIAESKDLLNLLDRGEHFVDP